MDTDLPDASMLCQHLLEGERTLEELPSPLPDGLAKPLVDCLKAEANRYWSIDPNVSARLGDLIIQIGQARQDTWQIALGTMARGDALKFLGYLQEAWDHLEKAAGLFKSINDEVGWARTRIGPLYICVDLGRVSEALADAEKAREVLTRYGQSELLVNLQMNLGNVYNWLGDCQQALETFQLALSIALALGESGESYLGRLNMNIGYTFVLLGHPRSALDYYSRALTIFSARQESYWTIVVEGNIANILQKQGHYRHALRLLLGAEKRAAQYPRQLAEVRYRIAGCYLSLNRYNQALEIDQCIVNDYETQNASFAKAIAFFDLAVAQARLADPGTAEATLNATEAIFTSLGASNWLAVVWLLRADIACRRRDITIAYQEARRAALYYAANQRWADYAEAVLSQGQALHAGGDLATASLAGKLALRLAQRCNIVWNRYRAHLLLAQLAEAQQDSGRACRHYQAASGTVERMQRGLTIALRFGFLEDKLEASRSLIRLYLNDGNSERAFETLERVKAQVFLSYLTSRECLRWPVDNPHTPALLQELERLREEYQWFYHLAQSGPNDDTQLTGVVTPEQLRYEMSEREKRIRAITGQLYLYSRDSGSTSHAPPPAANIQTCLPDATVMVEFYNDGCHLWAFTLDQQRIQAHLLPVTVKEIDDWLAQLRFNLDCALQLSSNSWMVGDLTQSVQRLARKFYAGLLEPLGAFLQDFQRLIVVPYGTLHYLPFHLLYTGHQYLIQRHEVVILPAASLLTYPSPQQAGGARVLAYSNNGHLPSTLAEAELVQSLMGGEVYAEQRACRSVLQAPPCCILHLATHGEFRIDVPELSFVELADGQLYTDDLIQRDLDYELITLSACETGLVSVATGDELIGLGRGCLYAGAGALMVSLWRADDHITLTLMEGVYRALCAGSSKAAALREAQCAILASEPALHPAFWGAFQLIGNAAPLSISKV